MRTRHPRRHLVLASATCLVALLMSAGAITRVQADAAWDEMATRAEELRARSLDPDATRAPVWGDATDDPAFEHYERAVELMRPLTQEMFAACVKLRELPDEQLVAQLGDLRARWRPALDALRAGAHARDVSRSFAPADELHTAELIVCRDIVGAAMLEARAASLEGEQLECVHRTLDAATLGVDCLLDGVLVEQMIATATLAIAVTECSDAMLARLSPASLEHLAVGLAALDERLPERIPLDRELRFIATSIQEQPDHPGWCRAATWRYGFSSRWMLADAFLQAADMYDYAATATPRSWADRQRMFERQAAKATASGNPAVTAMTPNVANAEGSLRQVIAQLRMLRMAVDMHRGVDRPPLPDPVGSGPLQVAQTPTGFELRTAISDERDGLRRIVTQR